MLRFPSHGHPLEFHMPLLHGAELQLQGQLLILQGNPCDMGNGLRTCHLDLEVGILGGNRKLIRASSVLTVVLSLILLFMQPRHQ